MDAQTISCKLVVRDFGNSLRKAGAMDPTTREPLVFNNSEEINLLAELLETEQARLMVGTRHIFHREYRDELHRRLDLVERLLQRTGKSASRE
ncbi:MAG TPA: hypothetical protein VGH38_29935 [Bryobacteraceae bacterium]